MRIKTSALFAFATVALACAMPASAATLDRIKETGHIRLGYVPDAKPFFFCVFSTLPVGTNASQTRLPPSRSRQVSGPPYWESYQLFNVSREGGDSR